MHASPTLPKQRPLGAPGQWVYGDRPLLIYWEATRACDLACIHCRAEAAPGRHPLELRTAEVGRLFRQITAFGRHANGRLPHLIITGGDPLNRPDLLELIAYGRSLDLPISVTPAGTPKLTPAVIGQLQEAGAEGLGLSLDGSDSARHDAFRGEPGSFHWTVAGIRTARAAGLPVQVNTMVTAETAADIPAIYDQLLELDINRWALFFLIATGRGQGLQSLSPGDSERFLVWLQGLVAEAPFPIKTTEAHHYRRIAWLKLAGAGLGELAIGRTPTGRGFGIRDGNGILFVSHLGDVYPSGFLPMAAGNVRRHNLVSLYRDSHLFRTLRDAEQLQGKCGRCEFRTACGGSRARAYAATGDPLGSDPLCPYQPRERLPALEGHRS